MLLRYACSRNVRELRLPVAELLLPDTTAEPLALPRGEVRVLHRERREMVRQTIEDVYLARLAADLCRDAARQAERRQDSWQG